MVAAERVRCGQNRWRTVPIAFYHPETAAKLAKIVSCVVWAFASSTAAMARYRWIILVFQNASPKF